LFLFFTFSCLYVCFLAVKFLIFKFFCWNIHNYFSNICCIVR
jgi:hypothetical protein